MREFFVTAGVLIAVLTSVTWGILRVVKRSSNRDFKLISNAMNENWKKPRRHRPEKVFFAIMLGLVIGISGAAILVTILASLPR